MKGSKVVAGLLLVMAVSTLNAAAIPPQDEPHGSVMTPLGKQLISELQVALQGQHYYQGDIDGLFGSETQEAIYLLQLDHALPLTGSVNVQLLEWLGIEPPAWLMP
ncbi:peptidoglycan-binding domain-containing protein [Pseudomonas sp. DCB_AW]|jgi:peptidoglycan hydrolase-like protein with peptidoglycan-binding domain|uniref:peptidoglycan-binding domain-containing protein n=1 Tax=Pseudomonas sp. DCB_AW TaxID=2993596 RepID=UPI0022491CDB|nr:peptidoglycan-binding domain-containing protein [Pseudomonas sp. DCB_AW]MCX2684437.1 peptidoglycan-binding domain-containing protein [Pseudomonas sp. DCB_AW]